VDTDAQRDVVPGNYTGERITRWLQQPLKKSGREQDTHLYIVYASRASTRYTPGFMTWDALPPH